MARQLEEIFNECIERLRQGDSVENCLMNYPEVAADLEILLRTALNVNWRASMVQPRPEFKAYARARLFNVQYAMSQQRQPAARKPSLFSLRHAWVPALAMVVILLFSSVGTAAAAANAMPDEPLYPVKLATEQVRLSFAFSEEAKVEINVQLAETRSQEIATMATQGKPEQVILVATDRMAQHIEAADQAIRKVEETKERQTPPPPPKPTITAPSPAPSTAPAPAPALPPTIAPTAPPPLPDKPKDATGRAGVQQTPPQEKAKVAEAEKLRQTLNTTISRNVTALENARDKAPEKAKPALQKAIDMAKNRQLQWQQRPGTGTPITPGTKPPTTGPGQTLPNPQNVPGSTGTKGSEEPPQRPGSQGSGTTPVTPTPTPSPTTPVGPKGTSGFFPPPTSPSTPSSSNSTTSTNNNHALAGNSSSSIGPAGTISSSMIKR